MALHLAQTSANLRSKHPVQKGFFSLKVFDESPDGMKLLLPHDVSLSAKNDIAVCAFKVPHVPMLSLRFCALVCEDDLKILIEPGVDTKHWIQTAQGQLRVDTPETGRFFYVPGEI